MVQSRVLSALLVSVLLGGCDDEAEEAAAPRKYLPEEPCDVISEIEGECPPPSNTCWQICWASSCDTPCEDQLESISCGEYGSCLQPCSQSLCEWDPLCDKVCLHNGSVTTCGDAGACLPKPDCLVEFWTDAGFTGARACHGTAADVEQAIANGGSGFLTVNQVIHNDQYSSFRTIEQVCALRGDSPCLLSGTGHEVKVGNVSIYVHSFLKGFWYHFNAAVESHANFSSLQFVPYGKVNDMVSSFSFQFSVAPICYRVIGTGCGGLCLDGGGYLGYQDCSVVAQPFKKEGWVQIDKTHNAWAWFDQDSQAPLQLYEPSPGVIVGGLHQSYRLVYPGDLYPIEWRVGTNAPVQFKTHVPGAF